MFAKFTAYFLAIYSIDCER